VNDDPFPKRMSHLLTPYFTDEADIVIAETANLRGVGMRGMRLLTTALVPLNHLSAALATPSEMGWAMKFGEGYTMRRPQGSGTLFEIVSPTGRAYEALVEMWNEHNATVMLPQSRLLATYGLQPRFLGKQQSIRWDDLERFEFDVVVVDPLAKYHGPDDHTPSVVRIQRQYAEDYADVRRRALVAVFFEQQSVAEDDDLHELLGGKEYWHHTSPGLYVEIKHIKGFDSGFPLYVAAWGCRLILKPTGQLPVSEDKRSPLVWPNIDRPITRSSDFNFGNAMDRIFARDELLVKYEGIPEFDVHPNSGGVSYGGRWSLDYSHRVGRDFIAYELRKIYEGCPTSVIEHVHQYVVDREVAEAQRREIGNANIGSRAEHVINSYYKLVDAIKLVADAVGLSLGLKEISSPTFAEVEYSGWWTFDEYRVLGNVAKQTMTRDEFLRRSERVFHVIEPLRESSLRRIVRAVGETGDDVDDLGSLKLLARLAQIASVSADSGLRIKQQAGSLIARWNGHVTVASMKTLFALNDLRQLTDHVIRSGAKEKFARAIEAFGIDETEMKTGWGFALDRVYDRSADALTAVASLLESAVKTT
jgi:hypothetical protein